MVGLQVLVLAIGVRVPASEPPPLSHFIPCRVRLGVRTPGSHPGNRGSSPLRGTIVYARNYTTLLV